MIIKGIFRRYERWNPVHPTSGAFWGMGIGLGCGVGWGPGFGPEVIGYVGAGCGVGFSVGITLAGFGIGLPANFVYEVPYNVFRVTRSGALQLARSSGLAGDGWSSIEPHISDLQRQASGTLSGFKQKCFLENGVDLSDMQSRISLHARSFLDPIAKFSGNFLHSRKGFKD